jgi:small subunit ribosomal protein S16
VAVKIRLMRVGKKKQPTYRVVVADGRPPRDGRFIEIIGQYAPRQHPSFCQIDAESALAWLRKGAQPTEQVQKLLAQQGVWAEYEAERSKPAVTKLSRRGYLSGKVEPGVKQTKAAASPAGAAAAPAKADDAPATDPEPAGVADDDASAQEAADLAIEESESQ